ncbi:hypothetical protein AVEN_242889-1 [Araneus ventricosus]|uniref:Uncharacterized protein n=1 Tax=Araneus ventricosus TaxID=182803 RepID=A0A4Y2KRQ4_ARAVE|nr:hypothetical protein AVEN_242889-1 [Araneus ventricosus]
MPTAKLRHWARAGTLTIDGHGRGLQNLFYAHRRVRPIEKLRHRVEGRGLKSVLHLWPHIDKIRHCTESLLILFDQDSKIRTFYERASKTIATPKNNVMTIEKDQGDF